MFRSTFRGAAAALAMLASCSPFDGGGAGIAEDAGPSSPDGGGAGDAETRPDAGAAGVDVARDAFERGDAADLGTADVGGAWRQTSNGLFRLADRRATASAGPASGGYATLDVDVADVDVAATFRLAASNPGALHYHRLMARTGDGTFYFCSASQNGSGIVVRMAKNTGPEAPLGESPRVGTVAVGDPLRARFQVVGEAPTTLRCKVWPAEAREPEGWSVEAVDTAGGVGRRGGVGLYLYVGESSDTRRATFEIDDFVARAVPASP